MSHVAVIGGGPAGLAAAEVVAEAGVRVTVYEAKPTVARKFLMAGKSGLNLTKAEDLDVLIPHYAEAAHWLAPALADWGPDAIVAWAEGLGQKMFVGSTRRVFPRAMKASPLLRAWLQRLDTLAVDIKPRHRCVGWDGAGPVLSAPDGATVSVNADAVILACGGASWARLGSDGAWADWIGASLAPFSASNAALSVGWSDHMVRHMGQPIKGVRWRAGAYRSRGEAIASARGLEGGGIYSVSRGVREGAELFVDLLPDLSVDEVATRLDRPRGKASFSNHLRKVLKLSPLKIALAQEWGRPWPAASVSIARRLKKLRVLHQGLRPMDEAISTAGGVRQTALDSHLMLRDRPGVFCAGEMLDWEAPTGGYLLTACLATGRWAGQGALRYLQS